MLALEPERAVVMLDGLRVVAEFRIDGADGLPDGSLDQRRTSGCLVEPASDTVEQGADGEVAIRLISGTGLAQHVVLDEVERGLGIRLFRKGVGLLSLRVGLSRQCTPQLSSSP